ncbi:MAG: hypothetical protein QM714_06885 [Nocardioides sp.]|uniref:hypothetical protein n=1 Tax=Nocardioides sp. TaxID=35761 RepID=UPI0039E6FDA4
MTATEQTTFLAVHGLVVKKAGTAEDVAVVTGVAVEDATAALDAAAELGQVLAARGKYMVTPAGRTWLDEQYPVVFAEHRANQILADAYERFEVVNRELLGLMTRWQTMTVRGQSLPNDHTDEAYDAALVDELGDLHEQALPVLQTFADHEVRLSAYISALENAQERILAGEHEFVSGARIQSYHTVWFELHEDLLRMLGRTREE